MIDKETIDKIYNAASILDVVSDFVSLKKRGANYVGCCPFHNEKTPSFNVSPARNIYHCFGCGKGGNAVNFIMEHEQMSYPDALKYLAKKCNIEIKEKEFTPEEKERNDDRASMLILNDYAKKTFISNMFETEEGRAIGLKYFRERGFSDETIKAYELGYSLSDRKSFTEQALKNGYQLKYLTSDEKTNIGTGLTIKHDDGYTFDRFSSRVMFPIHNLTGQVIGFGGRVLDARTKGVNVKYMNSPQSIIYDKSRSLYGIYQAKNSIVRSTKCYLVEGYTDVLSMHQSGIENVVSSNGTALTVEQIRLIRRFTENVTVLYDSDDAGIHAALRAIDLLLPEEMNVKVLLLPDGEDPDSFARNHSLTEIEAYIADNEKDCILFKAARLTKEAGGDPIKKAQKISELVKTISIIPDSIKRSVYVKECAEMLNVEERVLHIEINKLINRQLGQQYPRPENQPQQPKPASQVVLNPDVASNARCRQYENDLLKLLLNYGNDVLFTVAEGDKPSEDITVAYYIDKELKDNGMVFRTPVSKQVYDIYFEIYNQGQKPDIAMFINYHDAEVSKYVIDLMEERHTISKIWEKLNSYVKPETKQLKQVIDKDLNGYKLEIAKQTLDKISKEIALLEKEPDSDEKTQKWEALMAECSSYTIYKNNLSRFLDRVMC